MLTVTDSAQAALKDYFEKQKVSSALRVFLSQGGWSGPSLALALDESKESDNVYDINGITYLVDKTLSDQAKEIKVDFINQMGRSGFSVTSSMISGGGSCGSSCSCWWKYKFLFYPWRLTGENIG